jgi:hypothetical protein
LTDEPPWELEATEEFDDDYSALSVLGGEGLDVCRQSWEFYLRRDPVVHTTGLSGPDDDDCRVTVYSDPQLGVEYFLGVSIDRASKRVLIRWLDSCEFEPDFGYDDDA